MLFEIPTIEACILCQKFLKQENADAYTQSFVSPQYLGPAAAVVTSDWRITITLFKMIKKYSNIYSFVLDLAIFSHCYVVYILTVNVVKF